MNLPNASILELWKSFVQQYPKYANTPTPLHFYFCDNEQDANLCAKLVVQNIKQATAPSVWWYEHHNESMPQVGDLFIVTDWYGMAKAVIEIGVEYLWRIAPNFYAGASLGYTAGALSKIKEKTGSETQTIKLNDDEREGLQFLNLSPVFRLYL